MVGLLGAALLAASGTVLVAAPAPAEEQVSKDAQAESPQAKTGQAEAGQVSTGSTWIDNYARSEPQTTCAPEAKPGMLTLSIHIVSTYGGGYGGISRGCDVGGASEHKEGRAFDWMLDYTDADDQAAGQAFLDEILATDDLGHANAKARRMGIMYIIWNDVIYSASRDFAPSSYVHYSCASADACSATLQHRDHMHISISRRAAAAKTSWYKWWSPQV